MKQSEYTQRLLSVVPDAALRLFSSGWLSLSVREEGPALAWTLWDKEHRRFDVCFRQDLMDTYDDETLSLVMRHELGHVALGHFQMPPCGVDSLIASDISINWYLRKEKHIIKAIDGVDAEDWLEGLGLAQQPYPVEVLHDILHEKMDMDNMPQMSNQCGGIEQTDDPRAVTGSIITDKAMEKAGEFAGGRMAGTQQGGTLGLPYTDNLPKWLSVMEEFARATVKIVLAERRSHKRPQPALAGRGIHVPSLRPQWAPEPDTVCFLVDTSGSMWDELKYVQPVLEYLKRNQIEVRLIAGDIRVTFDEVITTVPTNIGGGGGTELLPIFERAAEYEPRSMVVFSDAYLSQIPPDPNCPVLWVGAQTEPPKWAQRA